MSSNNSDEHTDTPGDNVDGPPSNNTRSKMVSSIGDPSN